MMLRSLVVLALATAWPAVAPAGGDCGGGTTAEGPGVVAHIFETADADGDGRLTRAEYEGAGLQGFGVSFDESDLNADGETTMGEYLELYLRHHPSKDRSSA